MCGEADPVGDIAAVEALAFQQLEPALDDTVGVRGTVAGAHVREMGPGGEPAVAIDFTAGPLMLLWPNPSTNSYIPPSKTVLRRPLEPGYSQGRPTNVQGGIMTERNRAKRRKRELPDVGRWQPDHAKEGTLRDALMLTCQLAQTRVAARVDAETRFSRHGFDSGLDVEAIIREEIGNLLPSRYVVAPGIVSDRRGYSAGDCDLLVRDHLWSPVIKPGATGTSRRFHYPIEGIYAATEIKQTLGIAELDDAMKKLVVLSRLERPENPYGHITENQHIEFFDRKGKILNPLHTTVLATRLRKGLSFDDVVNRFAEINARLNRDHMVKMLCVLGHGSAWYSVASGSPYSATYMVDRQDKLVLPVNHQEPDNVFYRYFVELLGHLSRSVLALGDVANAYGPPPPPRTVLDHRVALFNDV